MNNIQTSISSNYVPNWTYREGIREIMQNAMDSEDKGHKLSVIYSRKKMSLFISNKDACLSKSDILLGSTDKSKDNKQRGQNGEGFKLGVLSLIRDRKPVKIHNGSKEVWVPLIEPHIQFDIDVLAFGIDKNPSKVEKLSFEIQNISPKEWNLLRDQFLPLLDIDKKTMIETPQGFVLKAANFQGRIYCGSIYVHTDKELKYGYDFRPDVLELNRDRNMVNSFDLLWNIGKAWAYLAAEKDGMLYKIKDMMKENIPDAKYIHQFTDYKLKGQIAEDFLKENGNLAFPVTSEAESKEVRSLGFKPVYSSESYSSSIRSSLGDIPALKRKIETSWELFHHLTPIDDANIQWVIETMYKIDPKFSFTLHIAEFQVDVTKSAVSGKTLAINHKLLSDKYEMLYQVIKYYGSETKQHASRIWCKLYKDTVNAIDKS